MAARRLLWCTPSRNLAHISLIQMIASTSAGNGNIINREGTNAISLCNLDDIPAPQFGELAERDDDVGQL